LRIEAAKKRKTITSNDRTEEKETCTHAGKNGKTERKKRQGELMTHGPQLRLVTMPSPTGI